MLLMGMKFKLDDGCETIYTTVTHIGINPDFLGGCLDSELDFALMHELMHLVLKHPFRGSSDDKNYNLACDIVVNSNLLEASNGDAESITLFGEEQPHLASDGVEGNEYSVEEVYDMFDLSTGSCSDSDQSDDDSDRPTGDNSNNRGYDSEGESEGNCGDSSRGTFDDHSRWNAEKNRAMQEAMLNQKIMDAYEASKNRVAGSVPLYVERVVDELTNPTIDWREVLNNFVQNEITDYSFVPPDYRMQESHFIMPGFNDPDERIDKLLFMIDTSGSMTTEEITDCYSEIKGAIDQMDGKLTGYIGFFDADVKDVTPFDETTDISNIKPQGGGGTNFDVIFDYVRDEMEDDLPISIIVLTDGYADFPKEKEAMGIPVLWVINNKEVIPPWGKHVFLAGKKK
ncbi:MAG: VWA-like domain-containing protein [Bacilli bacterium]|nr:VWA-like domain-containing protein [Bacilli bacterium]